MRGPARSRWSQDPSGLQTVDVEQYILTVMVLSTKGTRQPGAEAVGTSREAQSGVRFLPRSILTVGLCCVKSP